MLNSWQSEKEIKNEDESKDGGGGLSSLFT